MIYFRAKHPYSNKSDRWYKMPTLRKYEELDFEDYSYIFGDKIFYNDTPEAREAYERVAAWVQLKEMA